MDAHAFSAESPICAALKKCPINPLVFQADGNPFLIGLVAKVDDGCIIQVNEEAGYVTLIPAGRIVEIHTSAV